MALSWRIRCIVWVLFCGYLTTQSWIFCFNGKSSILLTVGAGMFAALGTLSILIALHISTLQCSQSHTLRSLLLSYILFSVGDIYALVVMAMLKRSWKRPREAQEKCVMKLIIRDRKTEYGRKYLSGIQSLDDFRRKHPLTKYDHFDSYFKRLADGEKNVCIATKLKRFGISSGTTGKGKLIPIVDTTFVQILLAVVPRFLKTQSPVQKTAILYCKPTDMRTKTGHSIAPVLFYNNDATTEMFVTTIQNSPFKAFQISTDFEATYVHLLFSLKDKNILSFFAPFASQAFRMFKIMEDEKDDLIRDISAGTVRSDLKIDEDVRRALDAALVPDPARANELRKEFAKGFVGIVGRIWPHLLYIMTVDVSGYGKKLEARYTKGTMLFATVYGCTEGMLGLNLWMDGRPQQYALLLDENLVEFIPENCCDEDNPRTLLVDEVEVGHRYEVAITTPSGFYRYRLGDVVEVVDFHENCPVIQVKYRTGELFNLRSEKMDVIVVSNAIQEMMEGLAADSLVAWTCAESPLLYQDTEDAHYDQFYLLFVELQSPNNDAALSAEQKLLFDKSMRKQHDFYNRYREVGTISEPRVSVVRPGTFERLKEYVIAHSTASYNQFKMPKKLRTKATLDLIMESVLDSEAKSN